MLERGVCLIAYGEHAMAAATCCESSLHGQYPVRRSPVLEGDVRDNLKRSRLAKVTLPQWSPYRDTLYLDADTLVYGDVSCGFEMLQDGWELVLTPSPQQGDTALWHVCPEERDYTYIIYHCGEVLQLQAGVFWFRKCEAILHLFEAWQSEWSHWKQADQGALLRALHQVPVKLHLLGRPFNGGAVIAHRYGSAV